MKLLLRLFFSSVLLLILAVVGMVIYLKTQFPKVESVTDVEIAASPEMLKRGEYLFHHVAACAECHSQHDQTRFSRPVVPGTLGSGGKVFGVKMGFPGNYTAKNLTPYHLEDWSDGELFRALTNGVDREGEPYFPIMPYVRYRSSSRDDLYAIIAYMRTLAPIENDVPDSKHRFPMNLIVRTIPTSPDFKEIPDPANTVAHGGYLANMASCIECHTPMVRGKPDLNMLWAGGNVYPQPTGGIARSANITPDKETGIGSWTKEQFIARFKAYDVPFEKIPILKPGEKNTEMPWTAYAGMNEQDLGAIFDFLMVQKPITHEVDTFSK